MRVRRIKRNQVLGNKINGKLYKVVEVKKEDGAFQKFISGIAAEAVADYDSESAENYHLVENGETVTVTEENEHCFSIVAKPIPEYPEGYAVKNGILFLDNESVKQGELVIKEVLATARGSLLLLVKGRKDGAGDDLFTYSIERDEFKKQASGVKELVINETVQMGGDNDESVSFLSWCHYRTEKKCDKETGEVLIDEDGKEITEDVFLCSYLLIMDEYGVCNISDIPVKVNDFKESYPLFYDRADVIVSADDGKGEHVGNRHLKMSIQLFENEAELWRSDEKFGDLLSEKQVHFVKDYANGGIFMRFKDAIVYDNYHGKKKESVVKLAGIGEKTDGFDYLVDRYWTDDRKLVFILANEDGKTLTVTSDKTKDRGYVVTTE